jgi:regulatory protein
MALGRGTRRRVDEHRSADPAAVRTAALGLLTRRDYASAELTSTLVRKGYTTPIVREVVSVLAGERLLDDARYADSMVRMLSGRGLGPARIRQDLRAAGLGDEQIAAALDGGPEWITLAADVRRRKFGAALPRDWPSRAKQMRFLQYRGFSGDHVAQVLGGSVPEEDLSAAPDP